MDAIWLDIPGWEGFYQVSNVGDVRSVTRSYLAAHPTGTRLARKYTGRVLNKGTTPNGYELVVFTKPGGIRKSVYVHDLVLLAFVGEKPKGLEVCHNDGNRSNNSLTNLRYDTRSNNALDRHKHGTFDRVKRGETHHSSKLASEDVQFIRKAYPTQSARLLAKMFNVTHRTIMNIIARQTWKHI